MVKFRKAAFKDENNPIYINLNARNQKLSTHSILYCKFVQYTHCTYVKYVQKSGLHSESAHCSVLFLLHHKPYIIVHLI